VPVSRDRKALCLGVAGAAAVAFLAALHLAPPAWNVCAGEVNRIFNVAAAWLGCAALFAAGAAAGKGARGPWNLLAVSLALIAFAETVTAYSLVVRDDPIPRLWLLNFAYLGAYAVVIVALAWKARSLPFTIQPLLKPVLLVVVTAIFAHVFYQAVRIVSSAAAMPGVAKVFTLLFPAADYVILVLATYIYTSYGRGVAGRPWMVVALGVLFIALSDLLGGFSAATAARARLYVDLSLMAQFIGYVAICWGAWYQRALLKDVDA
jgi:hypothetical protein